ncbi:BrnA antitoxin family protein [Methylobacterium terricola]|uniref:BrnA antitoxin family protein n=1 Tax=Methylobacterium terricola TaxID=2583531 RepID=A0A5C4L491_9HYPH|nr:BrnA antitoxin family protein [Methylobacterium terricola]TNC04553.1 BrnA antitoxin family protein [Methylobacterium terricola]
MTHSDHAPGYIPNPNFTQEDWDEVCDTPIMTAEELSQMKLGPADLPPELAAAFKSRGGRPKAAIKRVPISLRVEPEVLEAFKAAGPGWQTRMNEALAEAARRLKAA